MQCPWQARSGIGGDRGADRGILAARVQGAEPAGERCEHVSRGDESARGPCTCAVEVDWGADPMRDVILGRRLSLNAVHLSASIRNMVYWYLVEHSIYCGCVPCLNSIGSRSRGLAKKGRTRGRFRAFREPARLSPAYQPDTP